MKYIFELIKTYLSHLVEGTKLTVEIINDKNEETIIGKIGQ